MSAYHNRRTANLGLFDGESGFDCSCFFTSFCTSYVEEYNEAEGEESDSGEYDGDNDAHRKHLLTLLIAFVVYMTDRFCSYSVDGRGQQPQSSQDNRNWQRSSARHFYRKNSEGFDFDVK